MRELEVRIVGSKLADRTLVDEKVPTSVMQFLKKRGLTTTRVSEANRTQLKQLPFQVRKLFPKHEYECRKCGHMMLYPFQFCPKCASRRTDGWQVPPRYLNGSLSDYAHRMLAPALPLSSRRLLLQYFTEYINDGFETGTYSPDWTFKGIANTGAMDFIAAAAHHGNYGMRCTGVALDAADLCKTLGGITSLLYAKIMIRLNVNPLNAGETTIVLLIDCMLEENYRYQLMGSIKESGGQIYWQLEADNSALIATSTTPITVGAWYCIEVGLYYNVAGWASMWIDGSLLHTFNWDTTANTTSGIENCFVGIYYNNGTAATANIDFDCIILSDTYIEAELPHAHLFFRPS